MRTDAPGTFTVELLFWLTYGSILMTTLYQIVTMPRLWEEVRRLRRRAIRFRVLMAVFSASRFGEIALDLFGPHDTSVRPTAYYHTKTMARCVTSGAASFVAAWRGHGSEFDVECGRF